MRLTVACATLMLLVWAGGLAVGGVTWALPVVLPFMETITTLSFLAATAAAGEDTTRGAVVDLARFGVARFMFTAVTYGAQQVPIGRVTAAGVQWRLLAVTVLAAIMAYVAIIQSSQGKRRRQRRGAHRRHVWHFPRLHFASAAATPPRHSRQPPRMHPDRSRARAVFSRVLLTGTLLLVFVVSLVVFAPWAEILAVVAVVVIGLPGARAHRRAPHA